MAEQGGEIVSNCNERNVSLAAKVRAYLAYRRSLGFELNTASFVLFDFVRFANRKAYRPPLKTEWMLEWVTRSKKHSTDYHTQRLSVIRGLARYLAGRDGQTEIPDRRLLPGRRRQQPHIYTERQLDQLLVAAVALRPSYPFRPQTFSTLFGLLSSTGLRVSEALSLQRDDVNLENGLLHIRETKFGKSRWVPMHPTVKRALYRYTTLCDKHLGARPPTAKFFAGAFGKPLPYSTVRQTFRSICTKLGWRSSGSMKRPRIHDLRHSFACRRLLSWYRAGVDVNQSILALSTYMGHAKVKYTYWYLGGTLPLLSLAGDRFEQFINLKKGKQ